MCYVTCCLLFLFIVEHMEKGSDDRSDQEHSSSSSLVAAAPRVKRTRTSTVLEDLVDDPPHKKPKRDRQLVSDSLGSHLPEINETDKLESLVPHSISAFADQVLEQAKRQNS